jgi:hypothetical protein
MPLLLAGVDRHGRFQHLLLGRDVHEQIGMAGMVDLVEEDAQTAQCFDHLITIPIPDRRQQPVDDSESSLVVAGHFQRMRNEEEVRALGQKRLAETLLRFPEMAVQRAVGDSEAVAPLGAERPHGLLGFLAAALLVGVPVLDLLGASAAVGQEEDPHHGSGSCKLGGQAAAAEHLVVVMRSDDQDALGAHPLGPAGGLHVLVH